MSFLHLLPAIHIAVDAAATTRFETEGQDGGLPADLELNSVFGCLIVIIPVDYS